MSDIEDKFEECEISLAEYDILKGRSEELPEIPEPVPEKKPKKKFGIIFAGLIIIIGIILFIKFPAFTGLFVQNISNETNASTNLTGVVLNESLENISLSNFTENISVKNISLKNITANITENITIINVTENLTALKKLNDKFKSFNFEKTGLDLRIKHKKAEIRLKDCNESDIQKIQVVSKKGVKIKYKEVSFGTPVFAVNSINTTNATIVLDKEDEVNTIIYCPGWNFEEEECSEWIETDILFDDLGDKIRFTVSHFSAYAGSFVTDVASEWDQGLFTNTEKLGDVVVISGRNATGDYISYFFRNGTTANDIVTVNWKNIFWVDDYNGTTKYQEHPVRDSMAGYWKLNGNANDETSNDNDGTVNGAVPTATCKFGTGNCAYYFDGINDYINNHYISIPASDSLALDTQTIEMWFKPAVTYLDPHCNDLWEISLIGRFNSTYDDGLNTLYLLWLDLEDGNCQFGAYVATSDTGYPLLIDDTINAGQWYHIAVVFDDSNSLMHLYLDGVLKKSAGYDAPSNGNMDYAIGAVQTTDGVYDFFNGTIDNVIIYNRSLTAQEINESYARGTKELNITLSYRTANETQEVYNTSGLVGYWKLNNNADDETGTNNGTITGADYTSNGYFNGAYDFNTPGDYVLINHDTSLEPENVSIEGWVYGRNWTCPSPLLKPIFFKGDGVGDTWGLYFDFNDHLVMLMRNDGTDEWAYIDSSEVSLNEWHYIAGTYDCDKIYLYVDGILVDESDPGVTRGHNENASLIGGLPAPYNVDMDGIVDSVRVYNRTLTAEEIKYNYWHANFTNSAWSSYKNESPAGVGQDGKYFQYKARLATNSSGHSPMLEKSEINFSTPIHVNSIDLTPSNPTSSDKLELNVTCTSSDPTMTVYYEFYNNSVNVTKLAGSYTPLTSGANTLISSVGSGNLTRGQEWYARARCFDSISHTGWTNSNNVTIENSPPEAENVILNSSSATNTTSENLTLHWTASDADSDPIYNITNWYVNGESITVLNMPFDSNNSAGTGKTKDYSGFGNNGTVIGAVWTSSGYIGGAYSFDGVDDEIIVSDNTSLDITNKIAGCALFYANALLSAPSENPIFSKQDGTIGTNDAYSLIIYGGKLRFSFRNSGGAWSPTIESSTEILTGRWYYACGTYNGSIISLYLNGVEENSTSFSGAIKSVDIDLYIGSRLSKTRDFFNGTIDSVRIYNRSLSAQQVKALYQNRTDLIVSEEVGYGETWNATITPNDGTEDGTTVWSNSLKINSLPSTPSLTSPEHNSTLLDRTPTMNWTAVTDEDSGQTIEYQLLVDNGTAFTSPEINVTISDNNYTPVSDLYFDTYNWKVRAFDGTEYGSFSSVRNFTLITSITCSMPVKVVDFGEIGTNIVNNTEDENPAPMIIQNNGNLKLNITINATDLFSSQPNPSEYYQLKIDENETGVWDSALNDSWHNIEKETPLLAITSLHYLDTNDSAEIELQIKGPPDEAAGPKSSQINIWCSQGE